MNKTDRLAKLRTLLEGDINFLKAININPLITNILKEL